MAALAALWGFLRTPFGAGVAAVLAMLLAAGMIDARARRAERARIEAALESKQRKSLDEARSGIDDVRRCAGAGGVWDGRRAECRLRPDGP